MATLLRIFLVFMAGTRVNCAEEAYDDDLKSIFLRLYVGDSIDKNFIDAPLDQVTNITLKNMNLKKPTVLYIHGYTGSIDSDDAKTVITAYLDRKDHNVIAADWRRLAGKDYASVVNSAKSVGHVIAVAMSEMVDNGLEPDRIHVVGHSMGAQVASYLGRDTNFKFGRITGLDPAGPYINQSLTEHDAKFVDTIHTDLGHYGYGHPSSTVSFFPNGGKRVQPGCPTSFEFGSPEDFCSHYRSWHFYAESLRNEQSFIGTKCGGDRDFLRGGCNKNAKIPMGYATPTNSTGLFYLRTRKETPFGMQMEGAAA